MWWARQSSLLAKRWMWWANCWLNKPTAVKQLADLSFISFAHWSTFEIPKRGRTGRGQRYILFEANFFGDTEAYIEAFSYILPWGIRSFWAGAWGVPDALPFIPFYRHIQRKRMPPAHYYSAYPNATTTMVTSACAMRSLFDQLRAESNEPFGTRWASFLASMQTLELASPARLLEKERILTVRSPVRAGKRECLERTLAELGEGGTGSPLARVAGTHFARWTVAPNLENRYRTPLDSTSHLFFTSWFDCNRAEYIGRLRTGLGADADAIWGHCHGYPGTSDSAGFERFMLDNVIEPVISFCAYPDVGVDAVNDGVAFSGDLMEFVVQAEAESWSGSELEAHFDASFPPAT
jgi:hypothetical protein